MFKNYLNVIFSYFKYICIYYLGFVVKNLKIILLSYKVFENKFELYFC